MRSITHPKILFLNTPLPSTAQHWKSIYFLLYYHIGGFSENSLFAIHKAIRHISIIKAKKFEFLFCHHIHFYWKIFFCFSHVVLSSRKETSLSLLLGSRARNDMISSYTQKVVCGECGGGCFIHIYRLFLIFLRAIIVCVQHIPT